MDVAAWLRELGLERYERAFRDNEVDADLLPNLTADDLKDLGVSLVGHRRRLLDAIAALRAPEHEVVEQHVDEAPPAGQAHRSEAERRQLTVLFCDLVGSTELSGRLDPEDMRELISAYHGISATVITRYEGHVAKYMGDGVLAYFGWPRAHEDDAERAVRAGLQLVQAVGQLEIGDGGPLAARVGVATGQVVVGDLIGKGAEEEAVVGQTPNLAARLQALAEPGSVVIDPRCHQLVGGLFEYADLGTQDLKGFTEPVQTWHVLDESRAESRFEAMHGQQLTVLVGREHEIGLLADRWERTKEGEGQVVLLSGEPGIGKSRIVRALRARLANEPHTPLSHYCSPHHTNSALYPVIGLLERAAGFTRDDRAEARLDKLEALLSQATAALGEAVPLVAALLGIETGQRYPALALTPQHQKQRTLKALVDQVEGLAAQKPVFAVYEDVHWVDPSTLEALDQLIERVQRLPVLVLITFRPEFNPPWTGHAHVMQLSLSRLTRRHGQALVEEVTGGKALPDEMLNQILAKTDGVPLFVEELTKTVLESALLTDAGDHYALAGPLVPLEIPATLHDSLMARLDRLAPVKEVAQAGAVIGREFSHELLAAVSPLPEDKLRKSLDQLVVSELVFRRGSPPDANYTFKHALVQDAAYQSLLKSTRQRLHQKIARTLEEQFPATAETQPELLAYHYTEAQLTDQAIDYWQRAGQRASKRSATVEAIAQLSKALDLLESLPPSVERDRKELRLRIDLTSPLIASKGMAAPEMGQTITRARGLCERLGETTQLFPVLYGQWVFHHVSGQVAKSLEYAKEAARLAEGESSEIPRMVAHRTLGISLIVLGEPAAARRHLEDGNRLYDAQRHRDLALVYGMDFFEVNLAYLALTDWFLGFPDRALKANEETLRFARSLSHASSLCHALSMGAGTLHTFNRQFASAQAIGEELMRVADEHEMPQWSLFGRMFASFGLLEAEEEGTSILEACLETCRAVPMLATSTLALARLAESQARKGEYENALRSLEEADGIIEAGGERWARSEIVRLKGEISRAQSASAEAEACFRRAIEVAQRQGAKLLQLRAAASLARLWQSQGRFREARELLAPLYDWFTEGFDTADLKDAKALLDELG